MLCDAQVRANGVLYAPPARINMDYPTKTTRPSPKSLSLGITDTPNDVAQTTAKAGANLDLCQTPIEAEVQGLNAGLEVARGLHGPHPLAVAADKFM